MIAFLKLPKRNTLKNNKHHSSGFTILELIIVVVIIGVLVSLAIPKMTSMIERGRAMEAIEHLMTARSEMELCYINKKNYALCGEDLAIGGKILARLSEGPNSHFIYLMGAGPSEYEFSAQRNTYELGVANIGCSVNCGSIVSPDLGKSQIVFCSTPVSVGIVGCGIYSGIDTTPR